MLEGELPVVPAVEDLRVDLQELQARCKCLLCVYVVAVVVEDLDLELPELGSLGGGGRGVLRCRGFTGPAVHCERPISSLLAVNGLSFARLWLCSNGEQVGFGF